MHFKLSFIKKWRRHAFFSIVFRNHLASEKICNLSICWLAFKFYAAIKFGTLVPFIDLIHLFDNATNYRKNNIHFTSPFKISTPRTTSGIIQTTLCALYGII